MNSNGMNITISMIIFLLFFFFFFWSSSFLISYFCVLCETSWVYVKIVSPVSFLCDVNKRYVLCIIYGLMMYRATEKKNENNANKSLILLSSSCIYRCSHIQLYKEKLHIRNISIPSCVWIEYRFICAQDPFNRVFLVAVYWILALQFPLPVSL